MHCVKACRAAGVLAVVLGAAACGRQPAPPEALAAAQLRAAQAAAGRFTALYGTRASQPAIAWLARLAPLDTPALQARLATAPGGPGGQATVTSKATVTAVRAITATSVTLAVRAVITTTAAASGSTTVRDYAVTVTRAGGAWKASSISLIPAGSRL